MTEAKVLALYSAVFLTLSTSSLRAPARQAPVLELDHVYIVVTPGAAPELDALRRVGILFDTTVSRHDGEGTASVGAFFHNAYLELLWVDSTVATDSLHRKDRIDFMRAAAWRRLGASPFGVGLHFLSGSRADLRLPVRLDSAAHLRPSSYYILLRQSAESLAPDVFIMPDYAAVTSWLEKYRTRKPELFAHPLSVQRITQAIIHGAAGQHPRAAELDTRLVRFEQASTPYVELEFDGGRRGRQIDLRPALPLVLRP